MAKDIYGPLLVDNINFIEQSMVIRIKFLIQTWFKRLKVIGNKASAQYVDIETGSYSLRNTPLNPL